jgi:hypothetical protein
MHPTAFLNCQMFYNEYLKDTSGLTVVDFGAYDVNGTLKPIFTNCNYIGIDMCEGPNVDIVCNGNETPFEDNSVEVVTSSSNFEHDDCFWMTFLEMCRIIKVDGYIYVNAPSTGPYHGYPGDCWRFYKDSWKALEKWGLRNNYKIKLVESYIHNDESCMWQNSVGIFKKFA